MGLEKVVINQAVKTAKNTIKLEDSLTSIENKLVNQGFKLVEASGINPQNFPFEVGDMINGNVENPNQYLTPEFVCDLPILTQTQKQNATREVDRTKQGLTNIVDNTNKIKEALITVQQPLQVLEVTAENLNNLINTIKVAVKVIKSIPIPVAFGAPAISLPVNVLTILSDSLDQLDKFLNKGKGIVTVVPPLVQATVGMIETTIAKLNDVDNKVQPILTTASFIQAVVELQPNCPNVEQSDVDAIQQQVASDIQEALLQVGDTSVPQLNFLNEASLIERLQPNAEPPLVYKGFTLVLESDPDNTFSFPSRRIRGTRYFSNNLQTAEQLFFETGIDQSSSAGQALSGNIVLYNDPQELNRYSFSSSVSVLYEEMKFAIDQYLLGLRVIPNKFNISLAQETDRDGPRDIPRDVIDTFNQQNPLPDFVLNGDNIVRPEVNNLGGPLRVVGSISVNVPNVELLYKTNGGYGGADASIQTLIRVNQGLGSPTTQKEHFCVGYQQSETSITLSTTGSYNYELVIVSSTGGGSSQSSFDLISP